MMMDYLPYLSRCREIALRLGELRFPIDKLGAIIGKEHTENFKFAMEYVPLSVLEEVLVSVETDLRAETRFNYRDKEGVIKQRTAVETYAKIVALNYEIRMLNIKMKSKTIWEHPTIVTAIPDIKERKKLVGRFVKGKCEGTINYEYYLLIKSCVIDHLSLSWPF